MRPRAALTVVVLAVLLSAAGFGLYRAAHPAGAATLDDRARTVAAGLRCPTCDAQSAADSPAPMAQDMRGVIRDQLAAGRTPAQVRAWFVQRYGDEVLLDPAASGPGLLVWAVPVVALVVGVGAIALVRRNGGKDTSPDARGNDTEQDTEQDTELAVPQSAEVVGDVPRTRTFGRAAPVAALSVLAAVLLVASTVSMWPSSQGSTRGTSATAVSNPSASSTPPATAARASGGTASVEDALRRQAASALRAGDSTEAQKSARSLLRVHPDDPDGLLLLGLAQRASGDLAAGDVTLRRFLHVAPKHPAADSVRHLVGSF